jgi:hypothetical protein
MLRLDLLPPEILRRIAELLSDDEDDNQRTYKTAPAIGNLRLVSRLFGQVAQPYMFRRFNFAKDRLGSRVHHTRFFLRVLHTVSPRIAAYTEFASLHFCSNDGKEALTSEELALDLKIWQEGSRTLELPTAQPLSCIQPTASDSVLPWSAGHRECVEEVLDSHYSAVCTTLLLSQMVNLRILEINDECDVEKCWKLPEQFDFKLLKLHTILWNGSVFGFDMPLTFFTPLFFAAPNLVRLQLHGGYTCWNDQSTYNHRSGHGLAFSSIEILELYDCKLDVAFLAWVFSQAKHLRFLWYSLDETDRGSAEYNPEEMGKALLHVRETIEELAIDRLPGLYWVFVDAWDEYEPDTRILGSLKNFPKLRHLVIDFLSLVEVDIDGELGDKTLLDVIPPSLESLVLRVHYRPWQWVTPFAMFRQLEDVVRSRLFPKLGEVHVAFYFGHADEMNVDPIRLWKDTLIALCNSVGIRCLVKIEQAEILPDAPDP